MGEILNLIESVSGGFPSYFFKAHKATLNVFVWVIGPDKPNPDLLTGIEMAISPGGRVKKTFLPGC